MATSFPDLPSIRIVQRVYKILNQCWDLRVLCPCDDLCLQTCLTNSVTAMGYTLVGGSTETNTAYAHPGSLDTDWNLKMGPPLVLPPTATPQYLPSIYTGVMASSIPWSRSTPAQMITAAAWCRVGSLLGYDPRALRRSMHAAIARGLATSDHRRSFIVQCIHSIIPRLPLPRCCILHQALSWVRKRAHWAGKRYATWVLPPTMAPAGTTGDWCIDYEFLYHHWVSAQRPGHVCV